MFLPFSFFRKAEALFLHASCVDGTFSHHARCANIGSLSPTARSTDDAFSLFGKCVDGVLRAKNEDSRPFLKADEVEFYPYHLGEVEFGS